MTYRNPPDAPDIDFAGPVTFSRAEIAAACRAWGPCLLIPKGMPVDGTRLLWALAGNESDFGANCTPRHEMAYCTGRYSRAVSVVLGTQQFGHRAHCSFGPWQMMLVNADPACDPELFGRARFCAMKIGGYLNTEIFRRQQARTLEAIGDAFNSGNCHDGNVPHEYIARLLHHYHDVPLPPE